MLNKYYETIKKLPVEYEGVEMSLDDFLVKHIYEEDREDLKLRIIMSTIDERKSIYPNLNLSKFYRVRRLLDEDFMRLRHTDSQFKKYEKVLLGYLGYEEYKKIILLDYLDEKKVNLEFLIKLLSNKMTGREFVRARNTGVKIEDYIEQKFGENTEVISFNGSPLILLNPNAIFVLKNKRNFYVVTPGMNARFDVREDKVYLGYDLSPYNDEVLKEVQCNTSKLLTKLDSLVEESKEKPLSDSSVLLVSAIKEFCY